MLPAVSVLLPIYNNVRDLPHALRSLREQTLTTFEVVVIDDGSTDGSGELLDRVAAQDKRFRVFHQPNAGLTHALRRACSEARGALFARHDGDDISAPTRLERQIAYLDAHPRAVACGTWSWSFHPVEGITQAQRVPDNADLLRRYLNKGWNPLVHGSVMMRSEAYNRTIGGYRFEAFAEDYDLWMQLTDFGDLGIVESEEYLYQLNPAGLSYGAGYEAPIVQLALRLARERKNFHAERTSYRDLMQRVINETHDADTPSNRTANAAYAAGIAALRAGRYAHFRRHMKDAARGGGPVAHRAKQRLRLSALAPALRALYFFRLRGTPLTHMTTIAPNAVLPEWVRAHVNRVGAPVEQTA